VRDRGTNEDRVSVLGSLIHGVSEYRTKAGLNEATGSADP
jgi:hypothetical protein